MIGNKTSFILSTVLCFLLSYVLSSVVIRIFKIDYISQVNLNIFTLILSCLATISIGVVLLANNGKLGCFKMKISRRIYLLMSILGVFSISICTVIPIIVYRESRQIAFQNWNEIPPVLILVAVVVYVNLLYAPPYILNKTVLTRFKLTFLEKIVFYPVLSGLIFGLLNIFDTYLKVGIFSYPLIVLLLNSALITLLLRDYKSSKFNGLVYTEISVDWLEVFGVIFAATFNIFVFYSAVGESNAFLRGDMWGDAHRVAFLTEYGLNGYLASPIEGYPPFYSFFWSAVTKSLPIPYVNGLLIVAFFNHLFSILALYTFAKVLFKNSRNALLTIILWTTLSGFSWTYLIINPPLNMLSGNELLNYVYQISMHFGVYSGSIVSPIYADDHALTRLWSLCLLFASMTALMKGYYSADSKGEVLIFSSCFIEILLGHITEIPMLSLALLALFLLGKPSSKFIKRVFLAMVVSSSISTPILIMLNGLNFIYAFISFMPILMIIFAKFSSASYNALSKYILYRGQLAGISQKIKSAFAVLLLYVYGLMWIAILSKFPIWINYPIATLWYSLAVEWGFLGLLFTIALVKLGLSKEKWSFELKFIVFLLVLQLTLLIALNYLNYNFFYITTPYPVEPILFLPILALIASQALPTVRFKNSFSHKIKLSLFVLLVIVIFSLGSLDHVLSASYWKTNNGWWSNNPLNPSLEDFQLINFLYGHLPTSPYEFIGTFYDWRNPSSYVIYPSGMAVLSQPLIDILSQTNDSREISILTSIFHINYILVPKGQLLPPSGSLEFDGVDDYVEVHHNDTFNMGDCYTVEALISVSDYDGYRIIVSKNPTVYGINDYIQFRVDASSGRLFGRIGNGSSEVDLWGSQIPIGVWKQVVLRRTPTRLELYVDGKFNAGVNTTISALQNTAPLMIGKWANNFFKGSIAYIRIYNRALNENEIQYNLFNYNNPIKEGLVLWLHNRIHDGTWYDESEYRNNGTIFGAHWHINSYLSYAVSIATPIFENSKYKLYSINDLNLSKTNLLPSSKEFLTTTEIDFKGSLTLVDKLNRKIYLSNTSGEICPANEGKVIIHLNSPSENTENNIIVLTPSITIKGNITLSGMRSTWGYFYEIKCFAEKLTISGTTSFQIFNSFKSRIYIESFVYTGKYVAFPFPIYLRPDYAKEQIKNYFKTNYISPLSAVATPLGIIWTSIVIAVLLLRLASVRVRVALQWRRRS